MCFVEISTHIPSSVIPLKGRQNTWSSPLSAWCPHHIGVWTTWGMPQGQGCENSVHWTRYNLQVLWWSRGGLYSPPPPPLGDGHRRGEGVNEEIAVVAVSFVVAPWVGLYVDVTSSTGGVAPRSGASRTTNIRIVMIILRPAAGGSTKAWAISYQACWLALITLILEIWLHLLSMPFHLIHGYCYLVISIDDAFSSLEYLPWHWHTWSDWRLMLMGYTKIIEYRIVMKNKSSEWLD